MLKKFLATVLAVIMCFGTLSMTAGAVEPDKYEYPYLNPNLSAEERAENLLSLMTNEEKLAQCVQGERKNFDTNGLKEYEFGSLLSGGGSVPSPNESWAWAQMVDRYQAAMEETRLSIPIIYGIDAVHGHNNVINATIFPHNIGLGATNNPELVREIAHATAREMAATGIYWSFGPCTAIPNNIRWGRTYEGYSSDIDLVTELSEAYVYGFQGETVEGYKNNDTIAACAKHYALEGWTTNGVNQGNVILPDDYQTDEEYIENVLLPALTPYQAAIDAGVMTIMPSFNSINGLKCHENKFLLTTILKERMGFEGFVVGDWNAHDQCKGNDLYVTTGVDPSTVPLTAKQRRDIACFNAGLDMFMCGNTRNDAIGALESITYGFEHGLISQERLDDAVYRILRVKFLFGLFDERRYSDPELLDVIRCDEHKDIARQAVRESLVLLKNDNDIVGQLSSMDKIFVAGKSADNIGYQCGGWTISWQGGSGDITGGVSILDGMKMNAPDKEFKFSESGTGSAGYDVAIAVIGETPYAEGNGDANETRLKLDSTDIQCLKNIKTENPDIPLVVILVSGRPMLIQDQLNDWDGFIAAWLPGSEGDGVGQVLFDDTYDFKGTLSYDWPAYFKAIDPDPELEGKDVSLATIWKIGYGLKKGEEGEPIVIPEEPEPEAVNLPGKLKLSEFVEAADGVQTENTSDTDGGQNVGYFDAGRWVKYHVNVQKPGLYNITLRYSCNNNTAADHIDRTYLRDADGNKIAGFTTVNTNGWQNWTSVTTQALLQSGKQYIELYSRTGNLNVNWLQFDYIGDTVENKQTLPGTVDAEKVYSSTNEFTVDADGYINAPADTEYTYYADVQEAGRYQFTYSLKNTGEETNIGVYDYRGQKLSSITVPASAEPVQVYDILYLDAGHQMITLIPETGDVSVGDFTAEVVADIPQGDEEKQDAVTPIYSTESNPGDPGWFETQYLIENFLSQKEPISLSTQGSGTTFAKITIDPSVQYQAIDGFGMTLDETVVRNLLRMKPEYRTQLLEKLFDKTNGIGINTLKLTIGASDIVSKTPYTYNDTINGYLDEALEGFSIQKDIDYGIIDIIDEIRAINPDIKFVAAPYTAPGFMKQRADGADANATTNGGFFKTYYVDSYAEYLVKYLLAYKELGIDIEAITVQNEPETDGTYPSMIMAPAQEAQVIAALGEKLEQNGLGSVKILAGDTEMANTLSYVGKVFDNEKAFVYADGIAAQASNGSSADSDKLAAEYPTKPLVISGDTVYGASGFARIIDFFNSGATSYIMDSAILDSRATGILTGGQPKPSPVIQINTGTTQAEYDTWYMIPEYYMMGQLSKYIDDGARLVDVQTDIDGLAVMAAQNTDGEIVTVISNTSSNEKIATIEIGGYYFNASIPAGTVATYLLGNEFAQQAEANSAVGASAYLENGEIYVSVDGASFDRQAVEAAGAEFVSDTLIKAAVTPEMIKNETYTYEYTITPEMLGSNGTELKANVVIPGAYSESEAINVPSDNAIDPSSYVYSENIAKTSGTVNGAVRNKINAATEAGGYAQYKINAAESGTYKFSAHFIGTSDTSNYGSVMIYIDGAFERAIDIPQIWCTPIINVELNLEQGEHVMEIVFNSNTVSLSEFTISEIQPSVLDTQNEVKIEAEMFTDSDKGIIQIGSGITNTGYSHAYNYLDYYVNVPEAGIYELTVNASATYDNTGFNIFTGDEEAYVPVANNGSWEAYADSSVNVKLNEGVQRIRFVNVNSGINMDYFKLSYVGPAEEFAVTLPEEIIEDQRFTMHIVTPEDVSSVSVKNESGKAITLYEVDAQQTILGLEWNVSLMIGTAGEGRVLSIYDQNGELLGSTEPFTVLPAPVEAEIKSFEVPAEVNESEEFDAVVTHTENLVRFRFENETGSKIGAQLIGRTTEKGETVSTYRMSIGTAGDRTITVKADTLSSKEYRYSKDASIKVVSPADGKTPEVVSAEAPETAAENELFTVTVVCAGDVDGLDFENEYGRKVGKTFVSKILGDDGNYIFTYSMKIGTAGTDRNITVIPLVDGKPAPGAINGSFTIDIVEAV